MTILAHAVKHDISGELKWFQFLYEAKYFIENEDTEYWIIYPELNITKEQ